MSAQLMGRVFRVDLPGHLKLLLLALADEANDDGRGICMGQSTIALKVGATDRTVRANLDELRRRGLIHRLAGKHPKYHTDQYEIVVPALHARAEDVAGRPDSTAASVQVNGGKHDPDRKMLPVERPEVERTDDRKSGVVSTGSGLPPTQELPAEATQERQPSAARMAWTIGFEALARSVGKDPDNLTETEQRRLGTKLAEIRKAETKRLGAQPPADQLAGEIALRATRYRNQHPTWPLTDAALASHWSALGPVTIEPPPLAIVRDELVVADEDRDPPDEATIRRAIASHRRGCDDDPNRCEYDRRLVEMLERIPQVVSA